ncbi:MAG TPA: hypothetical protein V6C85_38640, partial [Allocoleopsis sp.]
MKESSQQPVTEALQSSSPIQRLDRRRTESPGVINVRSFQAQLARVPGWMMQRSALVDQLQRRYNSQENSSAGGEDLVLAAPSQPVPNALPLQTPTSVRTAAPSSSASAYNRTTSGTIAKSVEAIGASDSSLSDKFRVSHKAIPLPNGEGGASSPKKSSEMPSTNPLTKSDRAETVPFPQPSTQLQKEIGSTSQLSQQPESSLILPKRVNPDVAPTPTNGSTPSNFSVNSGTNIPTQIPTQPSTNHSTISTPSAQAVDTYSLIAPPLARGAGGVPDVTGEKPIGITQEISGTLNQSQPLEPKLIFPKRINPEVYQPSTSSGENFSSSPKLPTGAGTDVKSEIIGQTVERSRPPTAQSKVASEITSIPNTSQQAELSLILPKRINQDNSSDSAGSSVSLNHSPETQVERSSLSKNAAEPESTNSYNSAPINPSKVIQKIAGTLNQAQPLEPKLIFPKRINAEVYQPSTSLREKFSSSPKLSTGAGTNLYSEIIGQTVERSRPPTAQPTVAPEITYTPNISQQVELSLILPKRINQDTSQESVGSSVSLNHSSETQIKRLSLSKNAAKTASANSYTSAPINPSKVTQGIAGTLNQSQPLEPKLILPKRIDPEVYQPSTSSGENFSSSPKVITGMGADVKSEIGKTVERSRPIPTQPTVASEITSTPNTSQQTELSLILPKRINQDISFNSANDSILAKRETKNENVETKQDDLNTSNVAIA